MTRTWPLPRTAGGPRRGPTFLLRQHAGIDRRRRVQLHTRRDEALHRVMCVDAELDRLSAERVALLEELEAVRDTLWPAMPHWKCRRPPALDRPPLPPAPVGATPARAGDLRTLCLVLLGRNGPLALPDLHALLHRYGHVIHGDHPVKALADAMRYEVLKGRAVRVARGVYDLDPDLRLHGLPSWPEPGLGDPLPWDGPEPGPSAACPGDGGDADCADIPADQRESTDPARWGGDTWPGRGHADEDQHDQGEQDDQDDQDDHPAPCHPFPPAPPPKHHGNDSVPNRSRGTEETNPRGRPAGLEPGGNDVEDRPPP